MSEGRIESAKGIWDWGLFLVFIFFFGFWFAIDFIGKENEI